MLGPKNIKYRKPHRGRLTGIACCGTVVSFGDYGFRSEESSWMNSRQIESRRRVLTRYTRRSGKIWIRVFPDKAITARPRETRIGAGKGSLRYYTAVVYPGIIIFEICGISKSIAIQAIRVVASKLPVKIRIVTKHLKRNILFKLKLNYYSIAFYYL